MLKYLAIITTKIYVSVNTQDISTKYRSPVMGLKYVVWSHTAKPKYTYMNASAVKDIDSKVTRVVTLPN